MFTKKRAWKWIGAGAIFILIIGLFFGGSHALQGYTFLDLDDDRHIGSNALIQKPTGSNLLEIWRQPLLGLYIPVTYSTWHLIARWGGPHNPWLFHVINLLLHGINGVLVFLILFHYLRRWQLDQGRGGVIGSSQEIFCAGFAALLFGWHPVQVESVIWISELKGLLAALFLAVFWLCFIELLDPLDREFPLMLSVGGDSHRQKKLRQAQQQNEWAHFAWKVRRGEYQIYLKKTLFFGAVLAYILSLLAKPSVAFMPLAILAFDRICFKDFHKIEKTIFLGFCSLLGIPILAYTKTLQPDLSLAWVPPVWLRLSVVGDTLGFYLTKLLFPNALVPDYGRAPLHIEQTGWIYWSWILAVLWAIGAWWRRRRNPLFFGLSVSFTLSLFPVLGLICFDYQRMSSVADRYLYIPIVFIAFGLGVFLIEKSRLFFRAGSFTFLVLLFLGALSYQQMKYWKNNFILFSRIIEVNPQSFVAHNNLGLYYLERQAYSQAIDHLEQSAKILPLPEPLTNVGVVLEKLGRYEEAIQYHKKALVLRPDNAVIQQNLRNAEAKLAKP